MPANKWMIYGATGYSGGLLAREAASRGLKPLLAGRNEGALAALGQELALEHRSFGLDEPAAVAAALEDVDLVVHCAGPFSATSAPMIAGCLAAKTHYFDITGEISVYEAAHAQDAPARKAGILICPGVGFDVIPTDCIARTLAEAMPDATHLELGFSGGAAMSPGTAKTSVEGMSEGNKLRVDGEIVERPHGALVRDIDYGSGPRQSTAIPWGDVATAYYSTGIPNIVVYVPASAKTLRSMRVGNYLRPLIRLGPVQSFLKKRIEKSVSGPSAERRAKMRMQVWGEVRNAAGATLSARVETPNGYDVTITGPLAIVEHLLENDPEIAGYCTPSMLMGADFVSRLPGAGSIAVR